MSRSSTNGLMRRLPISASLYAARLGYRTNQREVLENATHEIEKLQKENQQLKDYILQMQKKEEV